MPWRVTFFETGRGSSPPAEFWQSLPVKPRQKVTRAFERLETEGLRVGEPLVKTLTGHHGLMELRVKLGSDAFRFFFFDAGAQELVVLHGIRKKSQKTPLRDLNTAEQRRAEYLGRHRWISGR